MSPSKSAPSTKDDTQSIKAVVLTPVLVWLALLAALAVTVAYAVWPHSPVKPLIALSISAFKAVLIALVFMRLLKETPLIRLTAGAALFWLAMLFTFAFADYLMRPPPS